MSQNLIIVFVCEHGAAKSILAAAYFNKFAKERALPFYAIARGTHPDAELSPATLLGLATDGLIPVETVPKKLSEIDLASSRQVIAFCELPVNFRRNVVIRQWNDVPSVSENYELARDWIVSRLRELMDEL